MVGVDGSPGSARALDWAVDEAARRHARLDVVHAWNYPWVVSGRGCVGRSRTRRVRGARPAGARRRQ